MEYVCRMNISNIVIPTLILFTILNSLGCAESLLSFKKEDYPDPRVQFQACNRPSSSWVCDPGKYLTTEQADEIDQRIKGIPNIGSVNAIMLGIVPQIILADGSPARNTLAIRDFTAYQFQNVWKNYAQNILVIVYHVARNEVWTQSNTNLVTTLCICQTTYETRQYLGTGDLRTVIDVFTEKFTGVLSGTATCSTASNNLPFMIDSTGLCTWDREIIISSLRPKNGLPSGGTEVVIRGKNLDLSNGNVIIGNLNCVLISRTQNTIRCRTSALQNLAWLNIPMPVFLLLAGQVQYNTGKRFVYTKPALIDVQPRTTIVSGGLNLTVSGTNLNLANTAIMRTLLRGTRTRRQIQSTTVCQVKDSVSILCPTPKLDIQAVTSQINRRHVGRHRAARAIGDDDASIPVENIEMSVTFSVNGENSPLENGQPAPVVPYADPVLYPFEGDGRTLTFISVWPKSERMVDIKGTGLLPVLKDHTLNVEVGVAFCDVQEIATNLIVCNPPINEPEKNLSTGPHPAVMAHVGNLPFDIGYLQYYDTLWKYPLTRWAIIGAAGAALLILIVIVVCCCAKKTSDRKKRRKRNKQNRRS